MTLRHLSLTAMCCLALSCAKLAPGMGGLGATCVRTSDCLNPFVCENGQCQLNAPTACNPGDLRCNGNDLEVCQANGQGFMLQETCDRGCVGNACRPEVCTPGTQRCSGNAVQECLPDGSGYATQQTCPTTCQTDPMDMTKAACTAPVCNPFETQCDPTDPTKLDTCNSTGTMYVKSACPADAKGDPTSCAFGRCLPVVCTVTHDTNGNVTTRQERCNGVVHEQCNDSGTGWDAVEVCQNGCSFDEPTGKASCPMAVCAPFSTQCAPVAMDPTQSTLQTCNSTGTAYVNSQCTVAPGQQPLCVAGACYPKLCDAVVTDTNGSFVSGDTQCSGNNTVQWCDTTEVKWNTHAYCQFGCQKVGSAPAQCAQAACEPGQSQCNGNALEACTPDQSGFGFVQYCPAGCVTNAMTSPPTAACAPPVCPPLNRQCVMNPDGTSSVEVCRADGTQYDPLENCPQGCAGGVCVTNNDSCNPGDYRCQGKESQLCVQLSNGATQWKFNDYCFDQCSSGACTTTSACGCSGGPSSTATCGDAAGNVQPIVLNAALPSGTTTVPCANNVATSRLLLYTNVIQSAEGTPVPDGTMVTFANDIPSGAIPDQLIASADADPSLPGIQRPTLNGKAAVLLNAPSCSSLTNGQRIVTVTASAGGGCAGTAQVTFVPQAASGPQTVYFSEDFTSPMYEDRHFTTAQWNTSLGAAIATPDYTLGTGADLDLDVAASTTLDLQASGYAPAWDVTALTNQGATLNTSSPLTLVPGDEVLLITTWGPAGQTGPGTYEFKHIASVSGNGVTFDQAIDHYFGNGTNTNLTGYRVVLQRVPQFNNVTIEPGATLTSSGPSKAGCSMNCVPSGGTGVLAFRARGTVLLDGQDSMMNPPGTISMDGNGQPTNLLTYPNVTPTDSLNLLLLGNPGNSPGSGYGGGVIFISAGTISFAADPTAASLDYSKSLGAAIHSEASTSDSGAGTVWVEGGTLQFGNASRVLADVGLNGHARIDFGSNDNTTNPMLASTTFTGQAGAFTVQSLTDYPSQGEQIGSYVLGSAQLVGALGGSGQTTFGAPGSPQFPVGVSVSVSADGGATWGPAGPMGVTFDPVMTDPMTMAKTGQSFRYKATLSTPSDQPLNLRAVSFQLSMH